MHANLFLRIILTIIALELGWIGLKDFASPISAQQGPAPTQVVIVGSLQPLKIEADKPLKIEADQPLKVEVQRYAPHRAAGRMRHTLRSDRATSIPSACPTEAPIIAERYEDAMGIGRELVRSHAFRRVRQASDSLVCAGVVVGAMKPADGSQIGPDVGLTGVCEPGAKALSVSQTFLQSDHRFAKPVERVVYTDVGRMHFASLS